MNDFFKLYKKRTSRASLAVLVYFLVHMAVVNPVFCYPTGGGANIEMCVLDFLCPCVCDHDHRFDNGEEGNPAWRNLCKVCRDIPISLGNDLIPADDGDNDFIATPGFGTNMKAMSSPVNSTPCIHLRDCHPPGAPPLSHSSILRC